MTNPITGAEPEKEVLVDRSIDVVGVKRGIRHLLINTEDDDELLMSKFQVMTLIKGVKRIK